MKILKILLMLVAAVVLVGLLLPSTTHVERSVVIDAAPQQVFSYLNDYRQFNRWSPWFQRDPNAQYEYSGPASGVGSRMQWQSDNEQVGSGAQEIMVSEPYQYLRVMLDFGEQGLAEASFTLTQQDGGTRVVWAFDNSHGWNLVSRYFGLMMDGWVGPDYEAGLANLKTLLESETLPTE